MGAGIGFVDIELLKNTSSQGAIIYANDLEPANLNELKKKAEEIGAINRVNVFPGDYPDEINFPDSAFDGILMCHVLHFFDGEKIERALKAAYVSLKPGGKLFICVTSPYIAWSHYIAEYDKKKKSDLRWPGYIENLWNFNPNLKDNLPSKYHFLDKEILERSLREASFIRPTA